MSNPSYTVSPNQTFNTRFQAGINNNQPIQVAGLELGVGSQMVDQFGRGVYTVKGYTPTEFTAIQATTPSEAVSLMTSSGLAAASAATDDNVLNLPIGAKVIGALITSTAAISGGAAELALTVGEINNATVDPDTHLIMSTQTVTNLGLATAGNQVMIGGGSGSAIGAAPTGASGGVPNVADGVVDQANSCINVVNTDAGTAPGSGGLEVIIQYVQPASNP
jgi:hypothetical protein